MIPVAFSCSQREYRGLQPKTFSWLFPGNSHHVSDESERALLGADAGELTASRRALINAAEGDVNCREWLF